MFSFAGFAKVTPDMKIVGVSVLYLPCWELRVFDAGARRGRVLEYIAQAKLATHILQDFRTSPERYHVRK